MPRGINNPEDSDSRLAPWADRGDACGVRVTIALLLTLSAGCASSASTERGSAGSLVEVQDEDVAYIRGAGLDPSTIHCNGKVTWSEDIYSDAKAGSQQAEKIAAETRSGKKLASLAKAGVSTVKTLEPLNRQKAGIHQKLGGELATKLFGLRDGEIAEGPAQDGISHSIVRLVKVINADHKKGKENLNRLTEFVRGSMTDDILAQYRSALRKKYSVEINDRVIDALFDELNVRG